MTQLGRAVSPDAMEHGWRSALRSLTVQLELISSRLAAEDAGGWGYLPRGDSILRALTYPLSDVRVVIVGQDPFPTPGHATGLAFSVEKTLQDLPPSLANVYRELTSDLGVDQSRSGDLSCWAEQGVLLLNRFLTLRPGIPGSHRNLGWVPFTDAVINALVERGRPLVAILWGTEAQTLAPLLRSVPTIQSAHPSAATAATGFLGSKPFSRANEALVRSSSVPIDWTCA